MRWVYLVAILATVGTLLADLWWDVNYRLAANVSLIYIAILTTTFTILYAWRSRWWVNRIGKIYLTKSIVMSLVLVQIVAATWWAADYPGRQHVRFLIYTLGALVYIPMLVSLWREQQCDRRKAKK